MGSGIYRETLTTTLLDRSKRNTLCDHQSSQQIEASPLQHSSTNMEVLFISHKYPPSIGGMQKQSYELINCFDAHGVAHHIVLSPEENRVTFFLRLRRRVSQMITEHPSIRLIHCNDGVCGVMGQLLLSSFDLPLVVTFHGLDLLWPNKLYQRWLQGGGICLLYTSPSPRDRG